MSVFRKTSVGDGCLVAIIVIIGGFISGNIVGGIIAGIIWFIVGYAFADRSDK